MKLAFGTDHAALDTRDIVIAHLRNIGHKVEDFGYEGKEICDYPDYAIKVARAVVDREADKGILVCGTGIGMAVVANKISGIIAAVCWNEDTARLAAQHNGANVLCLGSRTAMISEICNMIEVFLETSFEERHLPRIKKIKEIEKLSCK
jgi:ribose 5-phosphate isomerase B